MFLYNFYIISSSYVEEHVKKNSSLNFMSLAGFQASKIWMCFWKLTAEQVLKSFSSRNNSLKPPVFGFSNSLPYGLEESREFRALIRWVLNMHSKLKKVSSNNFFFAFLSCHYGFTNYFEILTFAFFLIFYLEDFQPVKHNISRINTSRNIKL